jgi:hypothetical protein
MFRGPAKEPVKEIKTPRPLVGALMTWCYEHNANKKRVSKVLAAMPRYDGTTADAPFEAAGRVELTKFGPQRVFTCLAASSYVEATNWFRSAEAE